MTSREPKKTSTIELRVSPELKDAALRLSSARGQSVSETIRGLLSAELDGAGGGATQGANWMSETMRKPWAKGGAMALSVGALAVAYSLAGQGVANASVGAEARVTFAELDLNADMVITADEYALVIAQDRETEPEDMLEVPAACEGTFIAEEIAAERAELAIAPAALASEEVAYLDSDGSGGVSFDELEAFLVAERAREFLEYDDDGNGFVTLGEVEDLLAGELEADEAADLAEEGLTEDCIEAVTGGDDDEDFDPADTRLLMAEYDADRDGRVSLVEFLDP